MDEFQRRRLRWALAMPLPTVRSLVPTSQRITDLRHYFDRHSHRKCKHLICHELVKFQRGCSAVSTISLGSPDVSGFLSVAWKSLPKQKNRIPYSSRASPCTKRSAQLWQYPHDVHSQWTLPEIGNVTRSWKDLSFRHSTMITHFIHDSLLHRNGL